MASIQDDKVIYYYNGKHWKTPKVHNSVLRRELQSLVESLIEYAKVGREPVALADRLSKLPDKIYDNLYKAGLVSAREKETSFSDLVDAYVQRGIAEVGPKAIEGRRKAGEILIDYYGAEATIKNARPADCVHIYNRLKEKYAETTISQFVARIHGLGDLAVRMGWLKVNPWLELKGGNKTNPDVKLYISKEDVLKAMRMTDLTTAALIGLQRFTGARGPSELYRLTWDDVSWSTGSTPATVKLYYCKTAKAHKRSDGSTYRIAYIPLELEDVLKELKKIRGNEPTVLGIPKKFNQKKVRAAFAKAGVVLGRPYNLRVSAVTDLRRSGITWDEYARVADHSLQTASKHYTTAETDQSQKETAKKIAANRESKLEQARRQENVLKNVKQKIQKAINRERTKALLEGTKLGTAINAENSVYNSNEPISTVSEQDLQGSEDAGDPPRQRGPLGQRSGA